MVVEAVGDGDDPVAPERRPPNPGRRRRARRRGVPLEEVIGRLSWPGGEAALWAPTTLEGSETLSSATCP
jgi:hypothetical protein